MTMDNQDRQAIDGLFTRLGEVERQAGPRDGEAEAFIAERIARQPGAPYYMAQTIVMQEFALQQAQARIEQLEQERQEAEERPAASSGILSSMFGGSRSPARGTSVPSAGRAPIGSRAAAPAAMGSPMGAPAGSPMGGPAGSPLNPAAAAQMQQGRGGGFLAGAAQTAMGVAGGMLLGSAIAGMFGGDEAKAAEPAAAEPAAAEPAAAPEPEVDAADDGGGFFDGWFGGDEEI